MTEFTDASKREQKTVRKCHICFNKFNNSENREVRNRTGVYTGEQPTTIV